MGFIVDFYIEDVQLVIEVDGSVHERQKLRDSNRDNIMKANHYTVLRFVNSEVFRNPDGIVSEIKEVITKLKITKRLPKPMPKQVEEDYNEFRHGPDRDTWPQQLSKQSDEPVKHTAKQSRAVNKPSSRRIKPPEKAEFMCEVCKRTFVAEPFPLPKCRKNHEHKITKLCWRYECKIPVHMDTDHCQKHDPTIHATAWEQAGTGARGTNDIGLRQSSRGRRKWTGS